ncbi:MAG TPA: ACT domain-containing protein [Sphingomicrobium sp.]|nr:ACT domain-containing protein [Sphingomicrobium sp.]
MSERLTVGFTPAEGAVMRVLGVIERRGYVLRALAMSDLDDGASLAIEVEPRDSGRRVEVLAEQLRRLVDVNQVSLATRDSGSSQ